MKRNARKKLAEASRATPVSACFRFLLGDALCFALLTPWLGAEALIPGYSDVGVGYFLLAAPVRFLYGIAFGLIPGFVFFLSVKGSNSLKPAQRFPALAYFLGGIFTAAVRYALWPHAWAWLNIGLPVAMGVLMTTLCRPPFLGAKPKS